VLNVYKESTLDHVYSTTPNLVENIHALSPLFGDHKLIVVTLSYAIPLIPTVLKRDWRSYTPEKLNQKLKSIVWENDIDSVQHYWNSIERKLVEIVDELAPMVPFVNKSVCEQYLPAVIKNKLNIRKRLLKTIRRVPSEALRSRIKNLNIEIKNYYYGKTKLKIRRGILPGNTKSLWDAFKIANNKSSNVLPKVLLKDNCEIPNNEVPDEFAKFFDTKVKNIVLSVNINEGVYNGTRKVNTENKMFMNMDSIRSVMESMKIKNSEGYDRIPQQIIKEGLENLLVPFTQLFKKIYTERSVPEQWLLAKTIPIH
jgi:hypothetical protein